MTRSIATKSQVFSSVVPAIATNLFHSVGIQQFRNAKCMALNALAIFHGLHAVYEETCTVDELLGFLDAGQNEAWARNRDAGDVVMFDGETLMQFCVSMGYISVKDEVVSINSKWDELNGTHTSLAPLTESITDNNRVVPWVKGGKGKPSPTMRKGLGYLQERAYHVERPMLEIINAVTAHFASGHRETEGKLPEIIKDELYVLQGSNAMAIYDELFSPWKADTRGRAYHAACFGPNPQSGDMARSLDSHNIESIVKKDSEAYEFFALEMEECAGNEWSTEKYIRYVAARPVDALIKIINKIVAGESAPAKPYMYVRMCLDWVKFQDNGECDCRISFGEDAKCSGTQILALLAGDEQLMQATGLVTGYSVKPLDPYMLCLGNIKKRVAKSKFQGRVDSILTRNFSKRPYMQVQYSGGVTSLVENSDFKGALASIGIEGQDLVKFAELMIDSVWDTLGARVSGMMDAIKQAVQIKCEDLGKAFFEYVHIDGFKVRKPCFKDIKICKPFAIRYTQNERIIFGNMKENKDWTTEDRTPDLDTFVRTFIVNYVQGIDALIARTVAAFAKEDGIRGFTAIHDCFRCALIDTPRLHKTIARAYRHIFIESDLLGHLQSQIGTINFQRVQKLTDEVLDSTDAYFFTAH